MIDSLAKPPPDLQAVSDQKPQPACSIIVLALSSAISIYSPWRAP